VERKSGWKFWRDDGLFFFPLLNPTMLTSPTHCPIQTPTRLEGTALWLLVAVALCGSLWVTDDRLTWIMEVFWIVLALPTLALVWRRLPLTRLLCWLLAIHALV
jgi:putative membrane protein